MKLVSIISALVTIALSHTLAPPAQGFQETNPACEYGTTTPSPDAPDLRMVSTFHSMGISWRPVGLSPDKTAHVLFKKLGSSAAPERSLDLVYVEADAEYRGSIVHLKSGTEYEVTLVLDGIEQEITVAETWCEQFPIAETVIVPSGPQAAPYRISGVVGSPSASTAMCSLVLSPPRERSMA